MGKCRRSPRTNPPRSRRSESPSFRRGLGGLGVSFGHLAFGSSRIRSVSPGRSRMSLDATTILCIFRLCADAFGRPSAAVILTPWTFTRTFIATSHDRKGGSHASHRRTGCLEEAGTGVREVPLCLVREGLQLGAPASHGRLQEAR